ncbi:MAG: acyltransferase [Bacteroidales bacterium]
MTGDIRERIFSISSDEDFELTALDIFRFQSSQNPVYGEFIRELGVNPDKINSLSEIPFMPIEFFKWHKVISGGQSPVVFFESSGTTSTTNSRHYVTDPTLYVESFTSGFNYFFGEPSGWMFAALLPSYVERGNSSLVFMADHLIKLSHDKRSSFYLGDTTRMIENLRSVADNGGKAMLIGVTYALLDLAEKHHPDLSGVTVVETGGMKGRRAEITRDELHEILIPRLRIKKVFSEYGMTELLSQAWSVGDGLFRTPPWMRIMLRDLNDPLGTHSFTGQTGGINVIDLANVYSCSFIATKDLGRLNPDGTFEVMGRFDSGDIRGCNLMIG